MFKRSLLITAVAMLAIAGCASQKGPATKAIADAEAAISAFKDDAARLLPDDLAKLETTLTGMKDNFAKGDYKAVVAASPDLWSKVAALRDATAAKKAEWEAATAAAKEKWTGYATDLPKMVDAIQSRVDILGKARRLPRNVSKEAFDNAKTGLDWMKTQWAAANDAFNSGDAIDAASKAQAVKDKGDEVLKLLGLAPSA
ncbi:MAG: hypothetical protein CMLOHMNK_02617 [Steroidobacteraceae bacterium]|nr:hypothetical protein [Steroidobacteraceae bacterium]